MRLVNAFLVFALLIPSASATASAQKGDEGELSLTERVFVASKIYASIPIYFAHWQNVPGLDLDDAYKTYLAKALTASDRREFDLASIEFVASLRNGHSGFEDDWLWEHYGQPLGFSARPIGNVWVVIDTSISALKPGDVIQRLDGIPMEEFYRQKERWISASSDKARQQSLFWRSYLFPEKFTLTLDGGRTVAIDRLHTVFNDEQKPAHPALKTGIEYLKIPSFDDSKFEDNAIDYIRQHNDARTFIVDVRGNGGGNTPEELIRALMDRPYREFSSETPITIGLLRSYQDLAKWAHLSGKARWELQGLSDVSPESRMSWASVSEHPEKPIFTGKIFILVDSDCASACEGFVAPFKDNHRATIIGESTWGSSGQPYMYAFGNGMSFHLGAKREYFPDGSAFEGIGIKPDIEVPLTLQDLKTGRDAALLKVEEMAGGGS
ncbi:MAG: S41 family peptidase [Candidatus Sulfotelmatobacter sp.]